MNFDTCQGIEQKNGWGFVEDNQPAVRRAAVALAVRGFWKVEEVELVGRKIEEGATGLVGL